jgi:hypothetical protein
MESKYSSYCGFRFDVFASFMVAGIFRGGQKKPARGRKKPVFFCIFESRLVLPFSMGGQIFVRKFGRKKPVQGRKKPV